MTAGVAKVEQVGARDGEEGDRWTEYEEHYNASVRRHGLRRCTEGD